MKSLQESNQDKKANGRRPASRPEIIAIRKTCDATGTGLSHYVLMDKQTRQ